MSKSDDPKKHLSEFLNFGKKVISSQKKRPTERTPDYYETEGIMIDPSSIGGQRQIVRNALLTKARTDATNKGVPDTTQDKYLTKENLSSPDRILKTIEKDHIITKDGAMIPKSYINSLRKPVEEGGFGITFTDTDFKNMTMDRFKAFNDQIITNADREQKGIEGTQKYEKEQKEQEDKKIQLAGILRNSRAKAIDGKNERGDLYIDPIKYLTYGTYSIEKAQVGTPSDRSYIADSLLPDFNKLEGNQKKKLLQDTLEKLKNNPGIDKGTRNILQNIVKDTEVKYNDYLNKDKTEYTKSELPLYYTKQFAKGFVDSFGSALLSMGALTEGLSQIADGDIYSKNGTEITKQAVKNLKWSPFYIAGKEMLKKTEQLNDKDKIQTFGGDVANGIGSMASFLIPGSTAAKIGFNPTTTTMILGALFNSGSQFDETLSETEDVGKSYISLLVNAGLGLTEAVPIGNAIKRITKLTGKNIAGDIFKGGLKGFFEEGTQEFGQQLGNSISDVLLGVRSGDLSKEDTWGEIMGESLYSGLIGGIIGLFMNGAGISGKYALSDLKTKTITKGLSKTESDNIKTLINVLSNIERNYTLLTAKDQEKLKAVLDSKGIKYSEDSTTDPEGEEYKTLNIPGLSILRTVAETTNNLPSKVIQQSDKGNIPLKTKEDREFNDDRIKPLDDKIEQMNRALSEATEKKDIKKIKGVIDRLEAEKQKALTEYNETKQTEDSAEQPGTIQDSDISQFKKEYPENYPDISEYFNKTVEQLHGESLFDIQDETNDQIERRNSAIKEKEKEKENILAKNKGKRGVKTSQEVMAIESEIEKLSSEITHIENKYINYLDEQYLKVKSEIKKRIKPQNVEYNNDLVNRIAENVTKRIYDDIERESGWKQKISTLIEDEIKSEIPEYKINSDKEYVNNNTETVNKTEIITPKEDIAVNKASKQPYEETKNSEQTFDVTDIHLNNDPRIDYESFVGKKSFYYQNNGDPYQRLEDREKVYFTIGEHIEIDGTHGYNIITDKGEKFKHTASFALTNIFKKSDLKEQPKAENKDVNKPDITEPTESIPEESKIKGLELRQSLAGNKVYNGEIKNLSLNPKEFKKSELYNKEATIDRVGAENVDLSEPIKATMYSNGEIIIQDGHHRTIAAKRLGKNLNVDLSFINVKKEIAEKFFETVNKPEPEQVKKEEVVENVPEVNLESPKITLEPESKLKEDNTEKFIKDELKRFEKEKTDLLSKAKKSREKGQEEIAQIYEGQAKEYTNIDTEDYAKSVRKNPKYYIDSNVDSLLRYQNRVTNLNLKPSNKKIEAKPEKSSEKEKSDKSKYELEREKGEKVIGGVTYTRQPEQKLITGKETEIHFSKKDQEKGKYALVPISQVQPSHKADGGINPLHFITEGQPRNRGANKALKIEPDKKAKDLDVDKLGVNNIAYYGASVINQRGEVVQGSGRDQALIRYFQLFNDDPKGYQDYLKSISEQTGISEDDIDKAFEKEPHLLQRVVNVSDERAIELGNYVSSDMEDITGKIKSIDKSSVSRVTSQQMNEVANMITARNDENSTLNSIVRDLGRKIVDKLQEIGVIREDELELYINEHNQITADGIKSIENYFKESLFVNGDVSLSEAFEKLPDIAKKSIEKSIPNIISIEKEKSLISEIQNAIMGLYELKGSGQTKLDDWLNAYDMFTGELISKRFTDAELELMKIFTSANTQSGITGLFKNYKELVSDIPEDLFNPKVIPGKSKQEALNIIINNGKDKKANDRGKKKEPAGADKKEVKGNRPAESEVNKESNEPKSKPGQQLIEKPKLKLDKEIDDVLNELDAMFQKSPKSDKVSFQKADITEEEKNKRILLGNKIIDVYTSKGIYDIKRILSDVYKKLGKEKYKDTFGFIKGAYASFVMNADDTIADKMNSLESVKSLKMGELLYRLEEEKNLALQQPKENQYDASTSTDMESDSGVQSSDGMGEKDIQSEPGESVQAIEQGSKDDGTEEYPEQSDISIPPDISTVSGEPGDSELFGGESELSNGTTPDSNNTGSTDVGSSRVPSKKRSAANTQETLGEQFEQTRGIIRTDAEQQQQEAESIESYDIADIENIQETLPYLLPSQHDDVLKAEIRFFDKKHQSLDKQFGKGILFTNATGTGKTLTGLGIVKRFVNRGKGNVIIVVPTDQKAKDWIKEGKHLNLEVTQLINTQDAGKGVVVTTYANYRKNSALLERDFDLVVYDESHNIISGKGKETTASLNTHHQITKTYLKAYEQAVNEHPEIIKKQKRIDYLTKQRTIANTTALLDNIDYQINELDKEIRDFIKSDDFNGYVGKIMQKTKVIFLSASPFAYHDTTIYGDGTLFNIRQSPNVIRSRSYNEPDPYSQFFIQNFGYRMRYNKLTIPGADVDVGLMEREFTERLIAEGVVTKKILDSDKDYSREFVLVDKGVGEKIDDVLDRLYDLSNSARDNATEQEKLDEEAWGIISESIRSKFNYLYQAQLMEAIKAKSYIQRIKQHLELGRKVIVYHSYNNALPPHPFNLTLEEALLRVDPNIVLFDKNRYYKLIEAVQNVYNKYQNDFKDAINLDMKNLLNPRELYADVFKGKVGFFNGKVSKKQRHNYIEQFQIDDSGLNLLVVQIQAGKEGISLHDTTGKYQRVLIDLALPIRPTDAIQTEGRIFRIGNKTDAIFEYPIINTRFERRYFADTIAKRSKTAENLALGNLARDLEVAFREGYLNPTETEPGKHQGIGSKESDARLEVTDEYDRAKTYYFARQKRSAKQKSAEGVDYFATPEPLGLKMAKFMNLQPSESALEPSAGHGAIARFFPVTTSNTFIEPSRELYSQLGLNTTGDHNRLENKRFEDLDIINKYDGIATNPPFGKGGKTAIEHIQKDFIHLKNRGRIVAIVPRGSMDDKLQNFLESEEGENAYLRASINLPSVLFERAGTSVYTQLIIIDKIENPLKSLEKQIEKIKRQLDDTTDKEELSILTGKIKQLEEILNKGKINIPPAMYVDLSDTKDIKEFFDRLKDIEAPDRITAQQVEKSEQARWDSRGDEKPDMSGLTKDRGFIIPLKAEEIPAGEYRHTEYSESKHTITGEPIFVVKVKTMLDKNQYSMVNGLAKLQNGYYSRFARGFLFKETAQATAFQNAAERNIKNAITPDISYQKADRIIIGNIGDLTLRLNALESRKEKVLQRIEEIKALGKGDTIISKQENSYQPDFFGQAEEQAGMGLTTIRDSNKVRISKLNDELGTINELIIATNNDITVLNRRAGHKKVNIEELPMFQKKEYYNIHSNNPSMQKSTLQYTNLIDQLDDIFKTTANIQKSVPNVKTVFTDNKGITNILAKLSKDIVMQSGYNEPKGFYNPVDNKVYINLDKADATTPAHEILGHYINNAYKKSNHRLYKLGLEIAAKDTGLIDKVKEQYPELSGERLMDEVLAQAMGTKFQDMFLNIKDLNERQKWQNRFKEWVIKIINNLKLRAKAFFKGQPEIINNIDSLNENSTIDDWTTAFSSNVLEGKKIETKVTNTEGSVSFQKANKKTFEFYSPLEKIIKSAKQEKFNATDFLNWVKNQKGFKPNELEWIGLDKFLADKKTVTKEQLLDYVNKNKIVLEEIVLGKEKTEKITLNYDKVNYLSIKNLHFAKDSYFDYSEPEDAVLNIWQDDKHGTIIMEDMNHIFYAFNEFRIEIVPEEGKTYYEDFEEAKQATEIYLENEYESGDNTKYFQYTLSGNKSNYREVLITLPTERSKINQRRSELVKLDRERPLTDIEQSEYNDLQKKWEKDKGSFRSSHFDEPNIVAHLRIDDRVSGKDNILFIEEMQSDWNLAGKKLGFAKEAEPVDKGMLDYTKRRLAETKTKFDDIHYELAEKYNLNPAHNLAMYKDIRGISKPEYDKYIDLQHDYIAAKEDYESLTNPKKLVVPDMPFKNNKWTELAIKKAIQIAVAEGYDGIAFINGEQTAGRYDLSKHFNRIAVETRGEQYLIAAWDKNNKRIIPSDAVVPYLLLKDTNELEQHVGKEMANRIISEIAKGGKSDNVISSDAEGNTKADFTGLDLEVKPQWALNLYDRQIPNLVKEYAKKLGGEVTEYGIDQGDFAEPKKGAFKQFGLKITPEMRKKVDIEGLPMFQKSDIPEKSQDIKSFEEIKKTYEQFRKPIEDIIRQTPALQGIRLQKDSPNNESRAEKRQLLKKAFGENSADIILSEVPSLTLGTTENFISYLKKKIPVKSHIPDVLVNMGGAISKDYARVMQKDDEIKSVMKKSSPGDLLKDVGYVLSEPKNKKEAKSLFRAFYKDGEVICTIGSSSDRWEDSYVTFFVRDDAKETPHAKDLTQKNITKRWEAYLKGEGRENPDGTYNLTGLTPNRKDPYSTSVMSVQISKKGKTLKTISRYNHVINDPDHVYQNLDNIVEGLQNAFYSHFNVIQPKGVKEDIPEGYVLDGEDRIYKVGAEYNGVYYGEGYYIKANGETVILDTNFERMADGLVFDQKNKLIYNVVGLDSWSIGIDIGDISAIEFTKDTIYITDNKGIYAKIKTNKGLITSYESNNEFIGNDFLRYNASLESLELPNNKTIGNDFLRYNASLESLELPNNKTIGDDFLRNNNSLKSLELPNNEKIGNYFLRNNKSLESLELPNNEKIRDGFLYYNKSLKSLELPNNKTIGKNFLHSSHYLSKKSVMRKKVDIEGLPMFQKSDITEKLQNIYLKYSEMEYQNNYNVGGGLVGSKYASNRHENALDDPGKLTLGQATQMFKRATGVDTRIIKEIIQNAVPNMEWHHAGILPKRYGGGMKKTYFLNATEIADIAKNFQHYKELYDDWAEKQKIKAESENNLKNNKELFLKENAKYVERIHSKPEYFVETNREMHGKYGWFSSYNKSYNMPEYYSGWEFENEQKLKEYYNIESNNSNISFQKGNSAINQTDTKAFKKWFGDSKVVDENGEPLVVYHGSHKSFDIFQPSFSGSLGRGMYFTNDRYYIANLNATKVEGKPQVYPVFLKLSNPLIANVTRNPDGTSGIKGEFLDIVRSVDKPNKRIDTVLKEKGYDGVVLTYDYKDEIEYLVLSPTQIKSAIGNNGNFDPSNPDIRMQKDTNEPKRRGITSDRLVGGESIPSWRKLPKKNKKDITPDDEKEDFENTYKKSIPNAKPKETSQAQRLTEKLNNPEISRRNYIKTKNEKFNVMFQPRTTSVWGQTKKLGQIAEKLKDKFIYLNHIKDDPNIDKKGLEDIILGIDELRENITNGLRDKLNSIVYGLFGNLQGDNFTDSVNNVGRYAAVKRLEAIYSDPEMTEQQENLGSSLSEIKDELTELSSKMTKEELNTYRKLRKVLDDYGQLLIQYEIIKDSHNAYFPFRVLEYINDFGILGTGQKSVKKIIPGSSKHFKGTGSQYDIDAVSVIMEHLTQNERAIAFNQFEESILKRFDSQTQVNEETGKINYGYVEYYFDPRRQFFKIKGLTDAALLDIVQGGTIEDTELMSVIRDYLAVGRKKGHRYIIPKGLADTISNLYENVIVTQQGNVLQAISNATKWWKKQMVSRIGLFSTMFHTRNQIGDNSKVFVAYPGVFSHLPEVDRFIAKMEKEREKAISDNVLGVVKRRYLNYVDIAGLTKVGKTVARILPKTEEISEDDLQKYWNEGVKAGTFSGQMSTEALSVSERELKTMLSKPGLKKNFRSLKDALMITKLLDNFDDFARMREAKMRFALYSYLRGVKGMTQAEAHYESGKVMINYNHFTPYEKKAFINFGIPFYSWIKGNIETTANTFIEGDNATRARIIGALLVSSLLPTLYNYLYYPDDEEKLQNDPTKKYIANSFHIATPLHDENGNRIYIYQNTFMDDITNLTGLTDHISEIRKVLQGQQTVTDASGNILWNTLSNPSARIMDSGNPLLKFGYELYTNKNSYYGFPLYKADDPGFNKLASVSLYGTGIMSRNFSTMRNILVGTASMPLKLMRLSGLPVTSVDLYKSSTNYELFNKAIMKERLSEIDNLQKDRDKARENMLKTKNPDDIKAYKELDAALKIARDTSVAYKEKLKMDREKDIATEEIVGEQIKGSIKLKKIINETGLERIDGKVYNYTPSEDEKLEGEINYERVGELLQDRLDKMQEYYDEKKISKNTLENQKSALRKALKLVEEQ